MIRCRTSWRRAALAVCSAFALGILLNGCTVSPDADSGFERLDSTISGWRGVDSASVSGTFDGLPSSRSLSMDITLEDASNADLAEFVDRTLGTAWTFDVYEPSSVFVSLVDGAAPVPDGQIPHVLDLTPEAASLNLTDVTMGKDFLSVSRDEMVEHYGSWPAAQVPAP